MPCTTCRIRNAPRSAFSCDAGNALPSVNDAGRFVGVAMCVLCDEVGSTDETSSDDEWIGETDGSVDCC